MDTVDGDGVQLNNITISNWKGTNTPGILSGIVAGNSQLAAKAVN